MLVVIIYLRHKDTYFLNIMQTSIVFFVKKGHGYSCDHVTNLHLCKAQNNYK